MVYIILRQVEFNFLFKERKMLRNQEKIGLTPAWSPFYRTWSMLIFRCKQEIPPNTDYRQAVIDSYKYNLSGKELDRRLTNGYYVKKDK